MNKAHSNINWENLPSTNTPLNQQNLNKMDNAIDTIDDRVIVHDNEITQLQGYETMAAQSATAAANSASTASTKATAAATSATNSENFYKYSKSYAVGGTGIRSGEDTDNSKYYYEQVKSMSSGGHAIMDSNGTAMAGRSILQFANSRVKDDATNDKTIVAPAHGHTNLLNPTADTTTINGVTCTKNSDGTYTLTGTATGWVTLDVCTVDVVEGVSYRLVGCPSGGSGTTYRMGLYTNESSPSSVIQDLGTGRNWVSDRTATLKVRIVIQPNYAISGSLVFKLMLTTDLSVSYNDYVQYSGSGELNENVAALYEGLESTDANLANVHSQIVTSGNIESGNTATHAHTVGTYIQWKGKFYVVTAAIAVGDTLAVGPNLAAKTVGEVLTQINSDLSDIGGKGNYASLKTIGQVENFKYSDYRFLYIALRTSSYSVILDSTLVPTDILPNSGVGKMEIGRYESPDYALTGVLVFDSSSVRLENLLSTGLNNFSDLLVYGIK